LQPKIYCSTVLDLGAQTFIISCALRKMGYNVVAFDVYPEPYRKIAEACNISVVRCDLERDELGVSSADCAVFTEVLEHLHYYYAPLVLSKINKALKLGESPSTHNTECGVAVQEAKTVARHLTRIPVPREGVHDERGTNVA